MNKNLRFLLISLGIILIGFVLWYFKSIVAYILISSVLALIGRPIVAFLNKLHYKKIKIPNAISALLTLAFLWFMLLVFFRVFIPLVAHQAGELSTIDAEEVMNNFKEPLSKIDTLLVKYNINTYNNQSIDQYLSEKFMSLLNVSMLSNVFTSIASILGNIFIAAFSISFITFFFLKDKGLFSDGILLFVPDKYLEKTEHILKSIKKLLTRYFVGIIVQVSGIITLVSIGLTIVGIDFSDALVIGLVVGLFNIIPYLGPLIGASLGLMLGLATNLDLPFYSELLPLLGYMSIVFIVVQVVDNVVFQPFIYSSSVNAHPLEIFLVIMCSGSLFGITGMILAIPSYTILRVVAKEFFNNLKLVKKLTEKI
ncbi:MAG TPA: AI-2E family transporter [Bacteroidales bacterium]|jgi:predicted PurR-regulated permease PerM|nr:AI-2E family transporter [Bacteroidales bacterium]